MPNRAIESAIFAADNSGTSFVELNVVHSLVSKSGHYKRFIQRHTINSNLFLVRHNLL